MPLLQWSTPVRQDGVKSLTPLPTEIYLAILSYARTFPFHKHHLQNLSLICRLFYVITIPWIFEEFTFTSERFGTDPSRRLSSLSREIRKGDRNALEMAKYVNRCNFTQWKENSNPKLGWCISELITLHSKSLRLMSNLRELSLTSTLITKNLLKAMAMLSHIESLKLHECSLDQGILKKHLSPLSSMKLKKLHYTPFKLAQDDSPPFEALLDHLNLSFLVEINSSNDHLLRQLVDLEGNLLLLKAVFRKITKQEDLVKLIAKAPSLELLHVSCVEDDQTPFNVEPHLLSRLKSLKFPAFGFNALVGGGNVLDVSFNNLTTLHEFQQLHRSPSPYTSMHVPAEIYLGVPFYQQFPKVETLEITFRRYTSPLYHKMSPNLPEIEFLVSKWPNHPPALRSLYLNLVLPHSLRNCQSYLVRQHSWVAEIIFPKIPSLRQCRFDEYFTWFYVEEDDQWKAEINAGKEQDITNHIPAVPIDSNGIVERIFEIRTGSDRYYYSTAQTRRGNINPPG